MNWIDSVKRNIRAGMINKLIYVIVPFISRTVLLRIMDADYLGLTGLFTSILSILSLAELGIDTAITFNMYKPIADNNIDDVCAWLNLYKVIYRRIGLTIMALGCCCLPWLRYIIDDDVSGNVNIYILFLIYLLNASLTYFLWAYKRSLLIAVQRNDLVSNISTVIVIFQNIFQVFIFAISKNYYFYILILPVSTILSNIACNILAKQYYPQYECRGTITKENISKIKKQVGGLVISKICKKSRNSFDSIVISLYVGLTSVTIYSNYMYVINAVHLIVSTILSSSQSVIGNSVATAGKQEILKIFNSIQTIYVSVSFFVMSWIMILCQDFMKLWAGESLLLGESSVILYIIYGFLLFVGDVKGIFLDCTGIWWENKWNSLWETIMNIVLNFVLGWIWGIDGVVIASIISLAFSNILYGPYILFKNYFGLKELKLFILSLFKACAIFAMICFSVFYLSQFSCNYHLQSLIISLGIDSILIIVIILVFYKKDMKALKNICKR